MKTKFIFITGGVVSALGKGITAASLGNLLKARGIRVALQKMDPYINLGPGRMSPLQHGEVFVTDDGAETDLDIGHYERFTDQALNRYANWTSGRIYHTVIERERRGEYGGGTVQVIPHITDEIKRVILATTDNHPDVVITEIGGTVGDMESLPFIEAIRQLQGELGEENCLFVHVTLVPYIKSAGELKTKPTQHSVRALRSLGIQPDVVVCRAEMPISEGLKKKLALFCNVSVESIVANIDCNCLYRVPLLLHEEKLDDLVCQKLGLPETSPNLVPWETLVQAYEEPKDTLRIALVGAYAALRDAYFSAAEALVHGGIAHNTSIRISFVDAADLTDRQSAEKILAHTDGILLPAAYGEEMGRGHVHSVQLARALDIPCLATGAALEALIRIAGPSSLLQQEDVQRGSHSLHMVKDSLLSKCYDDASSVVERYRLDRFCKKQEQTGISEDWLVSAIGPNDTLAGLEYSNASFLLGVAYHPEFKSRPNRVHPVFGAFIAAALHTRKDRPKAPTVASL